MNTCKNKRHAIGQLVLSAVTAGILAISSIGAPAWAGSSVHIGAGYSSGYHGGHYGYRGGYRGHYGGTHYGHGNDAAVALFAGLLFGGLLGYAISEDRQYAAARTHYYQAPPPAHAHSYYERPVQTVPAPVPAFAEPSGCLQTREYTTTINIDGQAKEAYGTRCLQADGTWLLGPPKLAPQF